jgi:hypothetical protein
VLVAAHPTTLVSAAAASSRMEKRFVVLFMGSFL